VHARLFKALANDGTATSFNHSRTYEQPLFSEILITHSVLISLKTGDFPFEDLLLFLCGGHQRSNRFDDVFYFPLI
jgi:hypothetical protein